MDYLSGVVERITFVNEENGFSVVKIKSKGFSDLVTVVGNMASVNVGAVVSLRGEWKYDSKFGRQFNVYNYKEEIPATVAGIEKYLGSGLVKGIGPVNAKRIVKVFKEDTIRIIEEEPDRLIEVPGIGRKRVDMIKEAWQNQKEIKNVMLFLQSHGVSTAFAVKIFKTYGSDSINIVKDNPYRLADDIWGIGFKTADKIAQNMGYDKESYARIRSGIMYALNEFANDGHCFAKKDELVNKASELLGVDLEKAEAAVYHMLEEKSIMMEEGDAVYLPPFYYSEVGVAKRIREITETKSAYALFNFDEMIENLQRECNVQYDEVQIEAIKNAVASKFMVLTGGPGTGKTTTTLAIIKAFQKLDAAVLLAAPTGRAAKRMSEATGMEAKTIHRLLEYSPQDGYKKNEDNPLECDVLIIDETSMIDIILMYNLLKAVSNNTVVILVGDVDQLPSVGAGNVLKDIIDSETVTVVRLTRIFRQARGSAIITNAHRINRGEYPALKGGKNSDFFFIEEEEPEKIVELVRELCTKRLPGYYKVSPLNDIQVLCPMQRGVVGAQNLNRVLQETLNSSSVSIKYGGTIYKVNDKVMQIKNNYDKNVFNGDMGIITDIDHEEKTVRIKFDDTEVEYDVTELDEVTLAYAVTVHKSQGSEYNFVVAPFTMQHYMMLQRNLLYTCVTRAKKALVLVGSQKALGYCIRNSKSSDRNTRLAQRLKQI
ncbi:MAG TPA: ATP-dependent RecD-like DNA helicase [Acetivibrio sp.]|uniref:SF1B family DNA helicase RecD2 n=1 Tax=Acetivibrio sp. TaxID=1872092 RepID=UPI002D0777E4|nr:ATP-dependent RecD-like DNA helicase [Acetivibrio sp.]HOM02553.1 ATP-dependent RecD-like DNA helicase [Acetivibrio sp.]